MTDKNEFLKVYDRFNKNPNPSVIKELLDIYVEDKEIENVDSKLEIISMLPLPIIQNYILFAIDELMCRYSVCLLKNEKNQLLMVY